jgi:hypothetical protein
MVEPGRGTLVARAVLVEGDGAHAAMVLMNEHPTRHGVDVAQQRILAAQGMASDDAGYEGLLDEIVDHVAWVASEVPAKPGSQIPKQHLSGSLVAGPPRPKELRRSR